MFNKITPAACGGINFFFHVQGGPKVKLCQRGGYVVQQMTVGVSAGRLELSDKAGMIQMYIWESLWF